MPKKKVPPRRATRGQARSARARVSGQKRARPELFSAPGGSAGPSLPSFRTPLTTKEVRVALKPESPILKVGAMRWSYVVRNRRRSAKLEDVAAQQAERCRAFL